MLYFYFSAFFSLGLLNGQHPVRNVWCSAGGVRFQPSRWPEKRPV